MTGAEVVIVHRSLNMSRDLGREWREGGAEGI